MNTEKKISWTVPAKLEALNCPKFLSMLKHLGFPSLELRGL